MEPAWLHSCMGISTGILTTKPASKLRGLVFTRCFISEAITLTRLIKVPVCSILCINLSGLQNPARACTQVSSLWERKNSTSMACHTKIGPPKNWSLDQFWLKSDQNWVAKSVPLAKNSPPGGPNLATCMLAKISPPCKELRVQLYPAHAYTLILCEANYIAVALARGLNLPNLHVSMPACVEPVCIKEINDNIMYII